MWWSAYLEMQDQRYFIWNIWLPPTNRDVNQEWTSTGHCSFTGRKLRCLQRIRPPGNKHHLSTYNTSNACFFLAEKSGFSHSLKVTDELKVFLSKNALFSPSLSRRTATLQDIWSYSMLLWIWFCLGTCPSQEDTCRAHWAQSLKSQTSLLSLRQLSWCSMGSLHVVCWHRGWAEQALSSQGRCCRPHHIRGLLWTLLWTLPSQGQDLAFYCWISWCFYQPIPSAWLGSSELYL